MSLKARIESLEDRFGAGGSGDVFEMVIVYIGEDGDLALSARLGPTEDWLSVALLRAKTPIFQSGSWRFRSVTVNPRAEMRLRRFRQRKVSQIGTAEKNSSS